MSRAVTVTGKVDVAGQSVALSGERDGKALPLVFVVDNDDALTWQLLDARVPTKTVFEGFKARIRFVEFPHSEERPLLDGGSTLDAAANGVIRGGSVKPDAFNGQYRYRVELVGPDGTPTNLKCSWTVPGGDPTPTGMGGIKRGGGPGG
jgi:hypothetical protein